MAHSDNNKACQGWCCNRWKRTARRAVRRAGKAALRRDPETATPKARVGRNFLA